MKTLDSEDIKISDEKVIITVSLIEDTLTDGSKVYNVATEFKTNFQEFANDISGHSSPIKLVDTSPCTEKEARITYRDVYSGLCSLKESEKQ